LEDVKEEKGMGGKKKRIEEKRRREVFGVL